MLAKLEVALRYLCAVSEMWPFVRVKRKATRKVGAEAIGSYKPANDSKDDDERALCSSPGCGRAGRVCPRYGLPAPCNVCCTTETALWYTL